MQEDVSEDMMGLSSRLLGNVRAMQGAVQAREGLLNQAEAAQDASMVNADYAVKTSKNIKNRFVVVALSVASMQALLGCHVLGCCYSQWLLV